MKYQIIILPTAVKLLAEISDRRVQEKIRDRIEALKEDPEKQGKPLLGDFAGYRSVRAVGQRYRIIYRVERNKIKVFIVALGIRKEGDREDVYRLARKLLQFRLLDLP